MATVLLRAIMHQVFHEEGSRADEAHVSFQHIDQLGQFIETAAPHQLAESRESIRVGQELPIGSESIGHRAEFIQDKGLTVKPGAFLREQERPIMKDPRRQSDDPGDRKNEWEKADGHHQVKDALPWEELGDGRLGGVDHMIHNGLIVVMNSVR